MLSFPVKLHHQHRFQHNGQWYVVDLEAGEVVPIDPVMNDILDCCETLTFHALVRQLRQKYLKQAIFEGVRKLEELAAIGLLVAQTSPNLPSEPEKSQQRRLRVFVLHSISEPDLYLQDSYAFLQSLSQHAEISYALFDATELPTELQGAGIEVASIQTDPDHSLARYLNSLTDSYDALLLLKAEYLRDLQLFECTDLPVVIRVSGDMEGTTTVGRIRGIPQVETTINGILAKQAAMRPYDAVVLERPWLRELFSKLLGHTEGLHLIPPPADAEVNARQEESIRSYLSGLFKVDLTSIESQESVENYGWADVAEGYTQLLEQSVEQRGLYSPNTVPAPVGFCQGYDPTNRKIWSQAVMFPDLLKGDMTTAIIQALSRNHTPREIVLLLESICTPEQAAQIRGTLSSDYL